MKPHIWYDYMNAIWLCETFSVSIDEIKGQLREFKTYYSCYGDTPLEAYNEWKNRFGS